MNKEPKKRMSISLSPDMLEKIENFNQKKYHGHMKVQNVMITMVSLGLRAMDYYDDIDIAWGMLEPEPKELKPEPAIVPSHGIVLEFPLGKRLLASQAEEDRS